MNNGVFLVSYNQQNKTKNYDFFFEVQTAKFNEVGFEREIIQ